MKGVWFPDNLKTFGCVLAELCTTLSGPIRGGSEGYAATGPGSVTGPRNCVRNEKRIKRDNKNRLKRQKDRNCLVLLAPVNSCELHNCYLVLSFFAHVFE